MKTTFATSALLAVALGVTSYACNRSPTPAPQGMSTATTTSDGPTSAKKEKKTTPKEPIDLVPVPTAVGGGPAETAAPMPIAKPKPVLPSIPKPNAKPQPTSSPSSAPPGWQLPPIELGDAGVLTWPTWPSGTASPNASSSAPSPAPTTAPTIAPTIAPKVPPSAGKL